ncbi:MAG: four helix bundle protein [Rickettsiales bacterium]|jgi:four helix bundle protein|nr:four helix bundle protein [Rickettsiales bacterium]
MKENVVKDKSKKFALRIIKLYGYLCDSKKEFILSKQVLRSGTSIGANLAEAECGISKKEFLAKTYIAFKECMETKYWLELLAESGFINKKEYESIYCECEELRKLLSSITKKTREGIDEEGRK